MSIMLLIAWVSFWLYITGIIASVVVFFIGVYSKSTEKQTFYAMLEKHTIILTAAAGFLALLTIPWR